MSDCCCSSGSCCKSPQVKKPVTIDFLYLDLSVCGRCQDTEKALDEAISNVRVVLTAAGYDARVNKVNITTKELAQKYRFISSPTIRVNGNDIAAELKESLCEDCGTLCGDNVDCRVWMYHGSEYTSPPQELIVNAILKEVYGEKQNILGNQEYELPLNLETYFDAKEQQAKQKNIESGDRI